MRVGKDLSAVLTLLLRNYEEHVTTADEKENEHRQGNCIDQQFPVNLASQIGSIICGYT